MKYPNQFEKNIQHRIAAPQNTIHNFHVFEDSGPAPRAN